MHRYRVLTYDITSKSSGLLAKALGGHDRIKPHGSAYRYLPDDIVVNWGLYGDRGYPVVNRFAGVWNSTSKLRSFNCFKAAGVKHPRVTTDRTVARGWLEDDYKVYCRSIDSGDHGAGITVIRPGGNKDIPATLFFTRGVEIAREFRIYVAFDEVLGIREKLNPGGLDPDVRASDEWIYTTKVGNLPPELLVQSIKACKAVGLDFVGVDVCLTATGEVCVFEVNSAPWLSPVLAEKLANKIMEKTND